LLEACQSEPINQYRYRTQAGLSNPSCAKKEASCSGVTNAPRTFRATFPGETSVIKKTAIETRIVVRRSKKNRRIMNLTIIYA